MTTSSHKSALVRRWQRVLIRLALLYLVAVAIGALIGHVALAVAIASSTLLGWYLWNAYRLDRWARSRARRAPPEAGGLWADVFDALHRNYRHQLARRRTLARILGEVRQVTDALPDGIVFLDPHNRVGWFNGGATRLLGLRKPHDVGRPLTNLLRSPSVRDWVKARPTAEPAMIIPSPADAQLMVRMRIIDYGPTRRVLLARDVTEVHRTEAMRRDFIANASHELKTPLTVISGYLETLEDDGSEAWLMVMPRMREQAQRMKSIIEDLLTLSRLEVLGALKDEQEVPMADALEGLLAEAEVLSGGRHRIELRVSSNANLRAEPKHLHSAFANLIANAVAYTPAGGAIEIAWRRCADGWLELAVRDDGPGIAAHHIPRLTERFYRVSRDRSRASGGTGLGLAIVKHVMTLHQGQLTIVSEPGAGSEFACRFPPEREIAPLSAAS